MTLLRSTTPPAAAGPVAEPSDEIAARPTALDRLRGAGVTVGVLVLLLVLAEVTTNALPDDPLFWVVTPLRLLVVIGLIAVAISCPPTRWRTAADPGIVLLLGGATLASVLNSGWPLWRALVTCVAVFYLSVALRRAGALPWRVLGPIALVAVAAPALTAVAQRAGGTPTGFCRSPVDAAAFDCGSAETIVRVVGTMSNPNLLAALLVVLLPVALGPVLARRTDAPATPAADLRWAAGLLVAAGYLAVWQTMSRAGVIAAVVSLTIIASAGLHRRHPRLVITVLTAGALASMLALALGNVGLRPEIWRAALALAAEQPAGVGLGRGGPLLTAALAGREQLSHAHNLWLQWLLEGGVLALAGVLALTVGVAWALWRAGRAESPSAAPLAAAVLAFGLMSLVDHPAGALRITLLVAVVLGWAFTARLDAQHGTQPEGQFDSWSDRHHAHGAPGFSPEALTR